MAPCGATIGIAAETACVAFQCEERMFHPGVADLFKALVVIGAAAHPIEVLWNHRVIGIWRLEPTHWLVAVVTRSCSYPETDLRSRAAELCHFGQLPDNDIGPLHECRSFTYGCAFQRRHHHRFGRAVDQLRDLDLL